jgi:predicted RNA-binding Zn ribbon-like protein
VTARTDTAAPLLGEPLPVELMNTIWADRSGVHDALATDAEVAAWLRDVRPRPAAGEASLDEWLRTVDAPSLDGAGDRLRGLRDALRRLAAAQTHDPRPAAASAVHERDEAVGLVNESAAAAPRWSSMEPAADGVRRLVHTAAAPGTAVVALLAEQAIEFFAGAAAQDLRACLAPGCVLYFVKQHPRREWCSTACGNRARAARHYRRHRTEGRERG